MSVLVLSVFAGQETAALVLRDLRAVRPPLSGLRSAATVSVGEARRYAVEATSSPGSGQGFPGMFWEALFGLVFLVPVPGSSYGPNAGALFGALLKAGVHERFLTRARDALLPGTSGLGTLLGSDDPADILGELLSHDAVLMGTSFSAEQDAELERELGGPA